MAYVAGLYTKASQASADEAKRFRDFQTQIDEMGARERAGLMRQQVAQMDQFTAGLTPRSEVALPDWTAPAAPPTPTDLKAPTSGGGADSGATGGAFYERDRAMRNYKLLEDQYNSELAAQKADIDSLGREKYILEQQLKVAPPGMQQRIRAAITKLNEDIAIKVGGTRERVTTFRGLLETISTEIRNGDYNRANLAAQSVGELPAARSRATMPGRETQPRGVGESGKASAIPVPDSIGFTGAVAPGAPGAPGTAPASRAGLAGLPPYVVDTSPRGSKATDKFTQAENPQATWWANKLVNMGEAEKRNAYEDIIYKVQPRNVILDEIGGLGMSTEDYNKMRAEREQKVAAVQFYRNEGVRNRLLQFPEELLAAQADPMGYMQAFNQDGGSSLYTFVERTVGTPAAKGPTPVADAVTAQTTAGGKTDLQAAPGVTPPQTPEAVAGAYPALDIPAATPLTGDPARVKAITEFSANAVAERVPERVPLIGPAVQSKKGQEYLARADEFEVPRAALVAVWGIESAFGKDKRKNPVSGTFDEFHVRRDQLDLLKKFYTDEAFIAEYGVPPKFTELANEIFAGGMEKVESVDAALLQLKMIEILGIPPNLWGAAYQGNAWDVLKMGAPTPTHDAGKGGIEGLTNSDYNTYFATLFNEARVVANTPMTTGTARPTEVSTFNLEKYDREQVRVESDLNYRYQSADTARADAAQKYQELQRRLAVAKQFGRYDEAQTILTEIEGVATNLTAVDEEVRQAELAAELKIEELNLARVDEYINISVNEFRTGNPKPFADMVSRGRGQLVEIVPVANSKLVQVFINNELVSGGGVTVDQALDMFLPGISESAKAAKAAREQKVFDSELKMLEEATKLKGEIAKEVTLKELELNAEFQKMLATNKLTLSDKELDSNDPNKITKLIYTDERGNVVEYTMGAETTTPQGVVTRSEPQVKVTRATGIRPQ